MCQEGRPAHLCQIKHPGHEEEITLPFLKPGGGLEASIYGLTVKLFKGFFLESLRLLTVVKQISGRGDMENVVTGALNPTNDRHGNSCCTEINKV